MRKIELLRKLGEIKIKGFSLTKDYDINSSIEEMEYEYELLKSYIDRKMEYLFIKIVLYSLRLYWNF